MICSLCHFEYKPVKRCPVTEDRRRITFLRPCIRSLDAVVDWTLLGWWRDEISGAKTSLPVLLSKKIICLRLPVHKGAFLQLDSYSADSPSLTLPLSATFSCLLSCVVAVLCRLIPPDTSNQKRTNREAITVPHSNFAKRPRFLDLFSLLPSAKESDSRHHPSLSPPTHPHTSPARWPRLRRKRTSSPSPSSTS